MRCIAAPITALVLAACASAPAPETLLTADTAPTAAAFDPEAHLWLEEVEGADALAWVTAQNERTLAALQADPHYAAYEAAALEVLNSSERIPTARCATVSSIISGRTP